MAEQNDYPAKDSALGSYAQEIGLIEFFRTLWKEKKLISVFMGVGGAAAMLIALSLPNIYQASVLLRPQSSQDSLSGLAGRYGGLASLAGISLPFGDGESKTTLAIEVLKSKSFAFKFANRHKIMPALFAADHWDWNTGTLLLDPDVYDVNSGRWVRKVNPPRSEVPSAEEVHRRWKKTVYVNEDKRSGFVTISIRHNSPIYAKIWLELLVTDINEAIRAQDLAEAERAVTYLEEQLRETSVAEIRELLAGLLRSHMESRMIAQVEPDYVFSVIDPPTVPELKSEPKRTLICVLGTLLGGMLGVVFSLVRRALRNRAESQG